MAYAHELNWYKIPLAKITKPSNTILYGLAGKEKFLLSSNLYSTAQESKF